MARGSTILATNVQPALTTPAPPHLYLGLANCILGNPCHMHLGELRGRQRALGNSNKDGIALVSPSCLLGPQKPEGTEED